MKKLLFALLMSFFGLSASAQVPVLTAPAGVCCGQYISFGISWTKLLKSDPTPTAYSYSILNSDQWGNPGSSVMSSGTVSGAPNSTEWVAGWNYGMVCGQYYLIQLNILSPTNGWVTTSSLMYYSEYPSPTISGNTLTCGTTQGYFCAQGLVNTEYVSHWTYSLNGAPTILGTTNCVNTPASYQGGLGLTVTNAYGCSTSVSVVVTNVNTEPDFTVSPTQNTPSTGYFSVTASRAVALPSHTGTTESWYVQETNTSSPYAAISGTGLYNTAWNVEWWHSNRNPNLAFAPYNGAANGSYNDQTLNNVTSPAAQFVNGEKYRIIRTVSAPGCPQTSKSKVIYQYGVQCSDCRFGEDGSVIEEEIVTGFNVFPNPGNGVFTVQLEEAADNAQAELFNMLGERVDAFSVTGLTHSYSPEQKLAPGVYLLRVVANGKAQSKRVVIE